MKKDAPPQLLNEKMAETIRQKIIAGELTPGIRLSETSLSEQLNISRNTLREVFRLLTQERLLHYEPNRGVCVAVPDMAAIRDIYRIRRLIECDALIHAYPFHPSVTQMEKTLEEAREYSHARDWRNVGTANMKFHIAIVELADSERLTRLYCNISAELRLAFSYLNDLELFYAPYVEKNAHILTLLKEGQNEKAAKAMAEYIELSERTVLAAWARQKQST
ncbi:GntR family transcriptional regulator [Serratia sp. UGAL515B_01]|uniref:GntR family transcriptional regulator n=1 Tax=Serratia sp. UGAL515B_01 TaxID=2986763 RepID=UPI002952A4DC|nr:GntR family transcriptional regulator [Serratia sp. UGAL515B_01]WON75851.1 GntR family transcriptional regulator [Serratia sp. UGAL515B_01]